MTKVKVKVGDVFQIPIDSARVGYGQVIMQPEKNVLFICVFAATRPPNAMPDLDEIVRSDILLAGNTFDAKFNHGHWPIVGNVTSNLAEIELPNYKSGKGDTAVVETLDRSRRRPATKQEEQLLPFRTYTAPVGFELAIKAIAGVGDWLADYDDLKYDDLKRSSEVIV
jgi:hypothetical protein